MSVLIKIVGDLERPYALGTHTTLGRDPGNHIVIEDVLVSAKHAEIRQNTDDSFQVRDLESSHGTFLGRERIEEPQTLTDGDELFLGATRFYFTKVYAPEVSTRWEERFDFCQDVQLDNGRQRFDGKAQDISLSGMHLSTSESMELGSMILLSFPCLPEQQHMRLQTRVMHSSYDGNQERVGLLFILENEEIRRQLAVLIAKLMRDSTR